MNAIGKFLSDLEKMKKYDRQNNNNQPDYNRFSRQLRNLFERSATCPGSLPVSVFDYWEKEYVLCSQNIKEEPTPEHTEKLGAMLAFINIEDEDFSALTSYDWQELGKLVCYESEDMPINILEDLMKIIVANDAY